MSTKPPFPFIVFLLFVFSASLTRADTFESDFSVSTRTWVGADFWANRLQDWRVTMGRLECLNGDARKPLRTVHWLTGQPRADGKPFTVSLRTGTLGFESVAKGSSFSGILIGAGEGELDYRGAALVHHFPGKGGGLLAVFNDQGRTQFLSNESETPDERPVIAEGTNNDKQRRTGKLGNFEDYRLTLTVSAEESGKRSLTLQAVDTFDGKVISETTLTDYPSAKLQGGIALVSPGGKVAERRYWFRDFRASGDGITLYPDRQFGPVLSAIYSLDGSRLKLNAQFPPLGFGDDNLATLQIRASGDSTWEMLAEARIEAPSFTALFKVSDERLRTVCDYRVGYGSAEKREWFEGRIAVAPEAGEEMRIAGLTCYQNIARAADGSWGEGAAGSPQGRWTAENVWFPHSGLVSAVRRREPSLIALLGDQIYEGSNPTASEANPHLDYLYKWYLTLWDIGRFVRDVPTVVMGDDHDVYQGDLWGDGGSDSRTGENKDGGYVHIPEFVQMVERTQTAANPEPAHREKLKQGLSSYYTSLQWGDVNLAILEDRKFKSLPGLVGEVEKYGSKIVEKGYRGRDADIADGQILGSRQEIFIENWIQRTNGARVAFTQTMFASLHTMPSGEYWLDLDSGGWPQTARNRALEILGAGNVLLMAGDTHLAPVVQHGICDYGDSAWQFVVPPVANKYRRWWDPKQSGANRLPNAPLNTGDDEDGFGNLITVAAVGNPKIDNAEVFSINQERGFDYAGEHLLLDKNSTIDGFGLIVISPNRQKVVFECWPADLPNGQPTPQHEGWPITLRTDPASGKWIRSENVSGSL